MMVEWIGLFRDEIWSSIGAIFGFFAVVISIWALIRGKKKKDFLYKVMANNLMLRNPEVSSIVIKNNNGEVVSKVYQTIIKVFNAWNMPILPTDFIENFEFIFDTSIKIIDAKIIRDERSLRPSFHTSTNSIRFDPRLFNPQDSFWLEILFSDYPQNIQHKGRIVGVKEIKRVGSRDNFGHKNRRILAKLLLAIMLVISVFIVNVSFDLAQPLLAILGMTTILCGILLERIFSANRYIL